MCALRCSLQVQIALRALLMHSLQLGTQQTLSWRLATSTICFVGVTTRAPAGIAISVGRPDIVSSAGDCRTSSLDAFNKCSNCTSRPPDGEAASGKRMPGAGHTSGPRGPWWIQIPLPVLPPNHMLARGIHSQVPSPAACETLLLCMDECCSTHT